MYDQDNKVDAEEYLATHCYNCDKYIAYGDDFIVDFFKDFLNEYFS